MGDEQEARRTTRVPGAGFGRGAEVPPPLHESTGEFICAGCGRPLAIALRSDMCFAEAQIECPECERDYQERRGRWAPEAGT